MYNVDIKESRHKWVKKNLVTISKNGKNYDEVECSECGMKGKRYGFTTVQIPETYKRENAFLCKNATDIVLPKRVRIIHCNANGRAFDNLTDWSYHNVIDPPKEHKNDAKGVWVMGNGEPVKILNNEFEIID